MKKLVYLVFLTLLLACNNQSALNESITTMSNQWEEAAIELSNLDDKVMHFQVQFDEASTQMKFKEAWKVQLKTEQQVELKEQISIVETVNTTLSNLTSELENFKTKWTTHTTTIKTLNSKVEKLETLPKATATEVQGLQVFLTESQEKINDWSTSLTNSKQKSEAASAKFSELIINLDPNIIACNGTAFDVVEFINNYATKIEAEPDKWIYSTAPKDFKDCSGMFLRLCKEIEQQNCEGYTFPSRDFHDTRALAGWFHKRKNLTLTRDAAASSQFIRPGMVLFYGYEDRVIPENYTAEDLAALYPKGLIKHIGVVTDVDFDDNGQVTNYEIYHGSRAPKPAKRATISAGQQPIYGNWGQPLLAVGHIMTPST